MSAEVPVRWIGEQSDDGQVGFRLGRQGLALVAEFVGVGILSARRDGGESKFTPAPGADPVIVKKLEQSLLPALVRHLTGRLTLHGSAVAWKGHAISCVGESGAGKSSTAANLCARFDAELVADDTCAVEFRGEHAELTATERLHWLVSGSLLPDAEGHTKQAVSPRALVTHPPRLVAVCRLCFDDAAAGVSLTRLRGLEALGALLPFIIRFVLDEPAMHEHEFQQLERLARAVPIYELRRPRRASEVDRSCQALVSLARTLSEEAVANAPHERHEKTAKTAEGKP